MSIRYQLLVLAMLITACRSSAPGGAPAPDVEGPSTNPVDPTSEIASWSIAPVTQEFRYISTTTTSLESPSTSGLVQDTITSTIGFSLSISRDVAPPSYTARVETISIQGGLRTRAAVMPPGSSLPFSFTGRIEPNRITLELPKTSGDTSGDCATEALAAVPVIQRSLVLVPLRLRKGMTWTDSVTTAVCSGPLLVSLSSVRTYLVKGQVIVRGRAAILLDQQNKTSFTGEGTQQQHRIRVRGEGSGSAQLSVDAETGAPIDATGDHATALVVTSSGRDQRFTQVSREQVTRAHN